MNRKFFHSCHKIVTSSSYSRPLFTSRLFGLSRLDRLRVTTGFKGVVDLDLKNDGNQRISQIIKYTSTQTSKQIKSEEEKKSCAGKEESDVSTEEVDMKKLSLFQRFKAMYRDYWYVLIPVHVVTSIGWFVGFYYLAESGIDFVAIAEKVHLSESLTDKLRQGGHNVTGYLAIAYALYKIATPIRYTVTLGGTTLSINYLKRWGYIKPLPNKADLKKMYEFRKESLKGRTDGMKAFMTEKFTPKKNP